MSSQKGYWKIGRIAYAIGDRVGYLGAAKHAAYSLLRRQFGCHTPKLTAEKIFIAIGVLEERQRLVEYLMGFAEEWEGDRNLRAAIVPRLVRMIF